MTELLVDSHCHLDFPDFQGKEAAYLAAMQEHHVGWALIAGVTLERFPEVLALVERFPNLYAGVGVHPDTEQGEEPTPATLLRLAEHPKVVAIGETGLDYYRLDGDLEWQRERFRTHIRAAKLSRKPLIIHTRESAEDTLRILHEENADEVGGVFHCFTETLDVAKAALDLGFYISISGIVTFKKALQVKDVATFVPLDRLLVETDSPYLAPAPYRGKLNQSAWVRHVAEEVAQLRGMAVDKLAKETTANFFRLFIKNNE
ncbi:DNAase [Rugosibacter aromaticivorans]|uniref:DNAase n=1 Tax=Rugosibacter aromaticivorans TaxID=1565605 RepID=A0A0C5J9H9_9PROT|nr:TatD family hydrolase [Rugosibacter aromaticivorans]AJP48354.1 DNAase [Rugosibacter aromaticivorans]TBR13776.1 MAG: TatD family deoxyribonuclease [Rugosibacter sp.]